MAVRCPASTVSFFFSIKYSWGCLKSVFFFNKIRQEKIIKWKYEIRCNLVIYFYKIPFYWLELVVGIDVFAWLRSVRKFLFCCRCGVSLTNSELDRVWVRLNVSNDGMYSYKSLIKAFAHKQTGQDVRREQTDSESRPALGLSTNGCYYVVD